ncbi:hypothetical protein [Plantactinospora sp. KLBMP9567]|uniref:hypothetical protein n=1 Tax=Plantactinospora sp. KLBMP9567 TaxID=3085900 RepID=UPI002980F791|nr:hypothetical protein [Plantactinospora sp. KLBMP9567]MDW5329797.1 hypothetical protein [Plantactinospora sp. KLBMP9567]
MSDENGHLWRTRSRHRTSDGIVSYQSCHCGMWRLLSGPARPSVPPTEAVRAPLGRLAEDGPGRVGRRRRRR